MGTRSRTISVLVGSVFATLLLAAPASAAVHDFANTSAIVINKEGAATPYPSNIAVAGVTGTVTDVNVSLDEFTHSFPGDVDILLVGPQGQSLILMSDVPADNNLCGADADELFLTFDDTAPGVPVNQALQSGTYAPTDNDDGTCESDDNFPAPAPLPPTGTTLGQFNGVDPNGTWSLYVFDDVDGDSGIIDDGWTLEITTEDSCPTPTSNIASGTPYDDQVIGDGPAAYWRLGESSGTVADDEIGANDGTYVGGVVLGAPGAIPGDPDTSVNLVLDPKSRVPTPLAHAAFNQGSVRTFEGWACRDENQGFDVLFSGDKRFNSPGMWTDHGDLDRIWFDPRREGGTGPRFWDGVMPPDGDWFYWALIFNDPANTAELFINGTSQGVRSVTEPYHSNPGNFQIGNYAQINEAWNGPLDEIAVYDRALTINEICEHHGTGSRGVFTICV